MNVVSVVTKTPSSVLQYLHIPFKIQAMPLNLGTNMRYTSHATKVFKMVFYDGKGISRFSFVGADAGSNFPRKIMWPR